MATQEASSALAAGAGRHGRDHAAGRKSVGAVLRAAFCLALSFLAGELRVAEGAPGLRLEHPSEGFLFRAPPDAAAMDIVVAVRGVPDPAWPSDTEGLLRRWEPYTLVVELDGVEADRWSALDLTNVFAEVEPYTETVNHKL